MSFDVAGVVAESEGWESALCLPLMLPLAELDTAMAATRHAFVADRSVAWLGRIPFWGKWWKRFEACSSTVTADAFMIPVLLALQPTLDFRCDLPCSVKGTLQLSSTVLILLWLFSM